VDFLDTNILVYAVSPLSQDAAKSVRARSLIQSSGQFISLQVLQEFYRVATHPKKLGFTHDVTVRICDRWRKLFTVLEPDLALFDSAAAICDRYQLSFFDAAIVAAAERCGCSRVFSEDMNDGQRYGKVLVENPFRGL
jgi:predicted nucleic acid-binding protein